MAAAGKFQTCSKKKAFQDTKIVLKKSFDVFLRGKNAAGIVSSVILSIRTTYRRLRPFLFLFQMSGINEPSASRLDRPE